MSKWSHDTMRLFISLLFFLFLLSLSFSFGSQCVSFGSCSIWTCDSLMQRHAILVLFSSFFFVEETHVSLDMRVHKYFESIFLLKWWSFFFSFQPSFGCLRLRIGTERIVYTCGDIEFENIESQNINKKLSLFNGSLFIWSFH